MSHDLTPFSLRALIRPALLAILLWPGLSAAQGKAALPSVQAASTSAPSATASAPAKSKTKKAKPPAQAKLGASPGESVAERERRLKRECKGRPNAGACLGFGE